MLDGLLKGLGIDPTKLQEDLQSFVAIAKDIQARLVRIEEKLDTHGAIATQGDIENGRTADSTAAE